MSFGGSSSKGKERATDGPSNGVVAGVLEEGEGFVMGGGRSGRGRDGAGAYEMVGMAPREAG